MSLKNSKGTLILELNRNCELEGKSQPCSEEYLALMLFNFELKPKKLLLLFLNHNSSRWPNPGTETSRVLMG